MGSLYLATVWSGWARIAGKEGREKNSAGDSDERAKALLDIILQASVAHVGENIGGLLGSMELEYEVPSPE